MTDRKRKISNLQLLGRATLYFGKGAAALVIGSALTAVCGAGVAALAMISTGFLTVNPLLGLAGYVVTAGAAIGTLYVLEKTLDISCGFVKEGARHLKQIEVTAKIANSAKKEEASANSIKPKLTEPKKVSSDDSLKHEGITFFGKAKQKIGDILNTMPKLGTARLIS
jgi:hypothetical protein